MNGSSLHLVVWERLALPKGKGGWTIKILDWFNNAMWLKSFWKNITVSSLWSKVFKAKYLKNLDWASWFRSNTLVSNGYSIIWNSFIKNLIWLKKWVAWDIGNGKQARVGIDSFVGDNKNYKLLKEIISVLKF